MTTKQPQAALYLLTSVLLANSLVHAVALPHQVLDPRDVARIGDIPTEELASAIQASAQQDPDNVFDDIKNEFQSRTGWDVIRDFFVKLFGDDNGLDNDDDDPVTTTVFVTLTPIEEATSAAPDSSGEIASATPSQAITTPEPSSPANQTGSFPEPTANFTTADSTPTPDSTEGAIFVLPVGSSATAINSTVPELSLGTGAAEPGPSTFAVLLPPFPANATTVGPLPTAVLITGGFPALPPSAVIPIGTGLPLSWPGNDSASGINPTLILTNPIRPTVVSSQNDTIQGTLTFTANLTNIVVVTATVTSSPVVGTGSIGTGLPIATDAATGLYPNITTSIPTLILSTGGALQGTGLSNATAFGTPLFPNTTWSEPSAVLNTAGAIQGTGISNATVIATPLFPNITVSEPTVVLGTGAIVSGTGISNATVTEIPLFINTTVQIPPLNTGIEGSASILNLTIPVTIAPFENSTISTPTPIPSTESPDTTNVTVVFTDVPISQNATLVLSTVVGGTGVPIAASVTGTGAPVSFTEAPLWSNGTETVANTLPGTGTISISAGVSLPATVVIDPLFSNVTTTTTTTVVAGTGVSFSPSGTGVIVVPSQTVEFPELVALRGICRDPQVRVVTLPLLSRFHGPGGYPSLFFFPGCTSPNARQAEQAPGLYNCTALGVEVQRCQAAGRKVLLSVKADGLDAVGGNADFGAPGTSAQPFGPYAIDSSAATGTSFDDDSDAQKKRKRQVSVPTVAAPLAVSVLPTSQDVDSLATAIFSGEAISLALVLPTPAETELSLSSNGARVTPVASSLEILDDPISSPSGPLPTSGPIDIVPVQPLDESPESTILRNDTSFQPNNTVSLAANISVPSTAPTEPLNNTVSVSDPVESVGPTSAEPFPNLFDTNHPPTALALTLFSLFGEGHTERADLRPLGPDVDSPTSPAIFDGTDWTNPPATDFNSLSRPLGEEVVVDGFDVQVPIQWKGTYQDNAFKAFVARLRQLNGQAWKETGAVEGGPGDLGADGRSVVYFGWTGELLKRDAKLPEGWVEWDGTGL
ncbi:hypothetical protein ACN47E_006982 [Coniothyrium glycines]